jgi:transposase
MEMVRSQLGEAAFAAAWAAGHVMSMDEAVDYALEGATQSVFQNPGPALDEDRGMSKPFDNDELWSAIAPLLPPGPPQPKGGRPRIANRPVLCGIIFVLQSGMPWRMLPAELGWGSGATCWRRLRDWQAAGVWERLHPVLLDRLGAADRIDWSRASVDSAAVAAKGLRQI